MKQRVIETREGIQGEADVADFDLFQRSMRDRGWIETPDILRSGIRQGHALEVGPGPGYLGLEWLRQTSGTRLTGLEISPAMIEVSRKNSREYGLAERTGYVLGDGSRLPFSAGSFDAVFSNGSLHEWVDPVSTLREMRRVLKPGGRIFVSDMRRDMSALIRTFLWISVKPRNMRAGFITSLNASYIRGELRVVARNAGIEAPRIFQNPFGLTLTAHV